MHLEFYTIHWFFTFLDYWICVIISLIIVFIVTIKTHDYKILIAILLSSLISLVFFEILGFIIAQYYYLGSPSIVLPIIGFISGIVAGLRIDNMMRSIFSAVAGVFFGYLINPYYIFRNFSYISIIFAPFPHNYFIIISLLFGAVGGLVGNAIRIKKK